MLIIEKTEVMGFESAIRGMRNPMNSWYKSDSGICKGGSDGIGCSNCVFDKTCDHSYDNSFKLGKLDHDLMMMLAKNGPVHAKYRRMITVWVDITAPLYWWKEFDTYKVGTVANSCSTMHKIQEKKFEVTDFSCDHLLKSDDLEDKDYLTVDYPSSFQVLGFIIKALNANRKLYLQTNDKKYWWQMIQLLPNSYNQKRTIMLNYEVLTGLYPWRKDHKLDEWHIFCDWVRSLPYSELITLEENL